MAASISASVVTTLAGSGMCIFPKLNQSIEMGRSHGEDVPHIAAFRIARPNCVPAIGQCYFPRLFAQFDNCLRFRIEPVHMHRFMIVRISDEPNPLEPYGAHASTIRLNARRANPLRL